MNEVSIRQEDITIVFWVITHGTEDYGDKYVVRRSLGLKDKRTVADVKCKVCDTLADARLCIPPGLQRIPRSTTDDPVIVESWL